MIAAVTTPDQKTEFRSYCRNSPFFHAVMGRDLALWTDNPGAPVKLFVMPGAALAISGRSAQLCGTPEDIEETAFFLRFAGVEQVTSSHPISGWRLHRNLYLYTLPAGMSLPAGTAPEGLHWRENPPVKEIARRLFEQDNDRAEAFYSETCTALAHGFARIAALYDGKEQQISTVGAYAMVDGEAYMAMGETVQTMRGRGIGGWLIASFANRLSAEGWQVSFLCEEERCHFYDGLGFLKTGIYKKYILE